MTYPSGRGVNFNYASGGGFGNSRFASVSDQTTGATLANSIGYDAAGDIVSRTLGNGVAEALTYNNRLQETSINSTLSGTTLMNLSYNYGTSGTNTNRVLSRTDSVQPEHSANYTYDSLYRLSQSVAPDSSWGISWSFDAWSNRLTQTPTGVATSKIGSQTLGYSNNRNNSFSYDAAGNQLNDGSHNYTFNAENQMTQVDGGAATYAYDGDGRRMKKTYNGETTYTFCSPEGTIISEFTTSNAIASATSATSSDNVFYHAADKLGSAVLVITSNGSVIENNRTLPYEEQWLIDTASTNDKKFTSYFRDMESGLDYAFHRHYGNAMGRFASVDSADGDFSKPVGLNRYDYLRLDPLNDIDPTGLEGCKDQPHPASPSDQVEIFGILVGARTLIVYHPLSDKWNPAATDAALRKAGLIPNYQAATDGSVSGASNPYGTPSITPPNPTSPSITSEARFSRQDCAECIAAVALATGACEGIVIWACSFSGPFYPECVAAGTATCGALAGGVKGLS